MMVVVLQDLENLYENTRQDLLVTQEALAKFQSSQQVSKWHILQKQFLLIRSAVDTGTDIPGYQATQKKQYTAGADTDQSSMCTRPTGH